MQIREEISACTRLFERLLSSELTLTHDERSLLEYYLRELAQLFHLPSGEEPPSSATKQEFNHRQR